ncbi:SUMO-activating enzyme subunit 2 [Teleopsis dalmanni]|uniref:SUMO-activating enzyme subunit 2 n=1 Tax=Teleopsis dalmanni TaxID=139649 RepID=UPI0018CCC170|nr:SUMO-activating enzyme subunit 2 [Teleopsis dalmanni]
MAASLPGVFATNLQEKILQSKILVVGAGGIGCEVLKNLVLSGFPHIEIIDLDTIDVSNLNRQFLFHKEHVGKSKAQVACDSALKFNPDAKIIAYHDSITASQYGVNFFKKFDVVLNALDNRAARNHVNRMCLNAEVPLIESGTAGYNGQVEMIKKGLTECYECVPKAAEKTFPGCTIRNTPSEPIHCIVWAKHLFNQLFGETVDEEDISPDVEDPEAQVKDSESVEKEKENIPEKGNVTRLSTRQWAKESNFDAAVLFDKFFNDDINYLLSMSNLWQSRKPPKPISWSNVLLQTLDCSVADLQEYHKLWSLATCARVFEDCLENLKVSFSKLGEAGSLSWDKDDQPAMDFVAACANIRAYIFEIPRKSRFEIKSMAGNIIPAIATTNAITAGVVVLKAFKILQGDFQKCQSVYTRLRQNARQQMIIPDKSLVAPNPKCYVCAVDPAIYLKVDTKRMRMKELRDDVLIKNLNMINPDVTIDVKGVVVLSSEEGETECNDEKFLNEMDIVDGVLLKCDDFFQNYILRVIIVHFDAERNDVLFEVIADEEQLKPKEAEPEKTDHKNGSTNNLHNSDIEDGPSTSKKIRLIEIVEDDDDLCVIEDDEDDAAVVTEATGQLTVQSPEKVLNTNTPKTTKRKQNHAENGVDEITEIHDVDDDDNEQDMGPTKSKRTRVVEQESEVIDID